MSTDNYPRKGRIYTEQEETIIRHMFGIGQSDREIAKVLGRPHKGVRTYRKKMGLRRTTSRRMFTPEIDEIIASTPTNEEAHRLLPQFDLKQISSRRSKLKTAGLPYRREDQLPIPDEIPAPEPMKTEPALADHLRDIAGSLIEIAALLEQEAR